MKCLNPSWNSRAWIELDLQALAHNVAFFQKRLPASCRIMPAVKANAYGHGAVRIAAALQAMGIRAFCVATLFEGIALRKHGIHGEILILGYTAPAQFPLLHQYRLTQTVVDSDYAHRLCQSPFPLHVHIGIDTGMHRLGIPWTEEASVCRLLQQKELIVDGIFTHLCASDSDSKDSVRMTHTQLARFQQLLTALQSQGCTVPKRHVLSSYGALHYPEYAMDYVRLGLALYGVLDGSVDAQLRPVLSLKARVASLRTLHPGETAGYAMAFTAGKEAKIATVTVGYGDGIPRALSGGKGQVLIHGRFAPIIGRVCMDQTLVDVSQVPDVQPGDMVTLIGKSGDQEITCADMAKAAGTISNEILSQLSVRLPRVVGGCYPRHAKKKCSVMPISP